MLNPFSVLQIDINKLYFQVTIFRILNKIYIQDYTFAAAATSAA